jgi:hypothetical protein
VVAKPCAVYHFPVARLGYHISGKSKDSEPAVPTTTAPAIDDYDPYLGVLLNQITDVINEYLIADRWPHLEFGYTGASPKEDAREYEARTLASTVNERRALHDQVALEEIPGLDEDQKKIARLMGQAPVDTALGSIYQAIVQAVLAPDPAAGEDGTRGAAFPPKKDAARSEGHGHTSGVRRDSRAEKGK